jgi:hypothetical protein
MSQASPGLEFLRWGGRDGAVSLALGLGKTVWTAVGPGPTRRGGGVAPPHGAPSAVDRAQMTSGP